MIDKDLVINGEYRLNKTIPSIASTGSLHATVKAYESEQEEIPRLRGDIASIGIDSLNIADMQDAVVGVSYNPDHLELVDAVGFTCEKEISAGFYAGITILSVTDGNIQFKLNS